MAQDSSIPRLWYRKPFGKRVVNPEHPYFSISQPSGSENDDAHRRRHLNDLAGL
ncbi:MAG: hypothetical protein ACRELV_14270 [Longimicrobiales bacterium]